MTSTISNLPIFTALNKVLVSCIRLAAIFGENGSEAIFITEDDEAFGMGANKTGCLGIVDTTDCRQPKKIDALSGIRIKTLAYGCRSKNHVLALTESGRVFSWGCNDYSQLGHGTTASPGLPAEVSGLTGHHVVQVSCGYYHTLALTSGGQVFAWGGNCYGQIGSGSNANQSTILKIVAEIGSQKVVQIGCCHLSSLALLDNGELFTWGYNYHGELGQGNTDNQLLPTRVDSLAGVNIRQVACGFSHVLALSADGLVYAWGKNDFGQVGTSNTTNQLTPVQVGPAGVRFVEVAASIYSNLSVARSDDGQCWVWGHYQSQSYLNSVCVPEDSVHDVFANLGFTYKPIIVSRDKKRKNRVNESLESSFDDPTTSDLKFIVEGRAIHVHKSVLIIQCEHFRAMFKSDWSESNKDEIELDAYSYQVYYAFLKYLYTDQVDLPPDQTINLLDLANSYFEDELKKICYRIIRRDVSVDNVLIVYAASVRFKAKELEDFCFKFIINHLTAVVESDAFKSLGEDDTKNLFVKAASHGVFRT